MSDQVCNRYSGLNGADRLCPHLEKPGRHGCAAVVDPVGLSVAVDGRECCPASREPAQDACRADQEVGVPGLHRLPRGREEAEDAEAASADQLRPEPGRVPGQVGPAARLSDGGAQLRRDASRLAKSIGLGRKPAAGSEPEVAKLPARRARGSKG